MHRPVHSRCGYGHSRLQSGRRDTRSVGRASGHMDGQQIYAGVSLSDQQTTTDGTCGRFEVSLMETDNTAQTQSAPTSHLPVHHAYRTCGTTTTTTVDSSSQRQSFVADG